MLLVAGAAGGVAHMAMSGTLVRRNAWYDMPLEHATLTMLTGSVLVLMTAVALEHARDPPRAVPWTVWLAVVWCGSIAWWPWILVISG